MISIRTLLLFGLCILLWSSSGYGWFGYSVHYSAFQWVDQDHFLAVRTIENDGAGYAHNDVVLVDIKTASLKPLTPHILGGSFSYTNQSRAVYYFTAGEIFKWEYPFDENSRPLLGYNSKTVKRIDQLDWVVDDKIVFSEIGDDHSRFKSLFDFNNRQMKATNQLSGWYRHDKKPPECAQYVKPFTYLQIGALKKRRNAESVLSNLTNHQPKPFIHSTSRYFQVLIGPYQNDKQYAKDLNSLRSSGYREAFKKKKKACLIGTAKNGHELYYDPYNVWQVAKKQATPLFSSYTNLHPIAPFRDQFVFLREATLFSLDIKTVALRQLSVDTSRANWAGGDLPLWNPNTKCLVFANNSTEKNDWWRVCLERALPEAVGRQAVTNKTLRKFDSVFAKKYGLDLDKQIGQYISGKASPQFQIEMEPFLKQRLVVKFMVRQGGYWANSVWIKKDGKERQLLPYIKNF